MRRLSSLVAVAAMLAMLLPASAAAATRTMEHARFLSCGLQSDLGFLSVFIESNSEFGGFAEVVYWEAGLDPAFDAPTAFGFGGTVTTTTDGLTATTEMVDEETGDPAGMATVDATLTPDGDPIVIDESGRDGNRWFEVTGTSQQASVSGSAALDEVGEFDLATGCTGEILDLLIVGNNPASYVSQFDEAFINCTWESETELTFLTLFGDDFGGGSDFGHFTLDGGVFGGGNATIGGGVFTATFDIFDADTEEFVGTGSAEGTFTLERGRSRTIESDGLSDRKIVTRTMALEGTLTVEIEGVVEEIPLDPEVCFGESRAVHYKAVAPKGPRGRVMPNDAPAGAIALKRLPARVLTNTSLTTPAPEVPCLVEDGGEVFKLPIGKTAWWTFTGTGRDATVNTARSSFDTAIAVYTWDGSDFVEVACVDDIFDEATETFSLLARATFPTDAGETYYIQVGGFGGNSGRLQLSVR